MVSQKLYNFRDRYIIKTLFVNICYTKYMEPKIFDHNSYEYAAYARRAGGRNNGAYWYSKEIVENIIPKVDTDRNWVTINVPGRCYDHSVVFIHNNMTSSKYDWLKQWKDLVLICGVRQTVDVMQERLPMHRVIYLPLSVDVKYVEQFKRKKTKDACFAGRLDKKTDQIPKGCDCIGNISRDELLPRIAEYRTVYAVGRCAIEAKILGAKIGIYDERFPDDIWEVVDNSEAAWMLQRMLDRIDGVTAEREKKLKDELEKLWEREKEIKRALKELEKEEEYAN